MSYENELKEYQERGFTKVSNFVSQDELKEIERELARFIEENTSDLVRDEINYSKEGVINSIHRLAGYDSDFENKFKELLYTGKFRDLASVFLEDKSDPRKVEFFGKPAGVGLKSPWHQDNFYWGVKGGNALTIWLALDFCDETNGGLSYVEGSHKLGTVDHKDSFAPGSSQTVADDKLTNDKDNNVVCPKLEPGDVLVHHAETIHGSADNKSDRSRRGITFQYKGENSEYDEEMINHYKARLNMQVDSRESDSN